MTTPTLILRGPGEEASGFRYLWLKYVTGPNMTRHCAQALQGRYSQRVKRDMALGRVVALDEFGPYSALYLCGVSPRWATNLHVAFRPGPGRVRRRLYNGLELELVGVEELPIIALPEGWRGFGPEFTTCRNFQFAAQLAGLSE